MRQYSPQSSPLDVTGEGMCMYSSTHFISKKNKLWNIRAYACTMIAVSPF